MCPCIGALFGNSKNEVLIHAAHAKKSYAKKEARERRKREEWEWGVPASVPGISSWVLKMLQN